jgi:Rrf2 family protein
MLRLTKKVEYSLIALRHIALTDGVTTAKDIAERFQIPRELLAKILQKMTRAGIIRSIQGPKGGYVLESSLQDLSLSELIRIIEGGYEFVECASGRKDECLLMDNCIIRSPLLRVNKEIQRFLTTISVADVIRGKITGAETFSAQNQ